MSSRADRLRRIAEQMRQVPNLLKPGGMPDERWVVTWQEEAGRLLAEAMARGAFAERAALVAALDRTSQYRESRYAAFWAHVRYELLPGMTPTTPLSNVSLSWDYLFRHDCGAVADLIDEEADGIEADQRDAANAEGLAVGPAGQRSATPTTASMSYTDAVRRLGVKDYTVTRLVDQGALRTVGGRTGRGMRITVESVEQYEAAHPPKSPARPKMIEYECNGCGEAVLALPSQRPRCPRCSTSTLTRRR